MKHVTLTRVFSVSRASDLDAHTDLVMDELLKLENEFISDSDVSASLTDHEVEITVVARADDFDEARKLDHSDGDSRRWRKYAFLDAADLRSDIGGGRTNQRLVRTLAG